MPITKFKSPHLLAISEINIRILWAGLRSHSELNRTKQKTFKPRKQNGSFHWLLESTLSNQKVWILTIPTDAFFKTKTTNLS